MKTVLTWLMVAILAFVVLTGVLLVGYGMVSRGMVVHAEKGLAESSKAPHVCPEHGPVYTTQFSYGDTERGISIAENYCPLCWRELMKKAGAGPLETRRIPQDQQPHVIVKEIPLPAPEPAPPK